MIKRSVLPRGLLRLALFALAVWLPTSLAGLSSSSYGYDVPVELASLVYQAPTAAPIGTTGPVTPLIDTAGARPDARTASRASTASISRSSAAKAAHDVPIGPVAEKAHKIADRVAAKGAPLPGYKGGRTFENNGKGMLLPKSNADGAITYREWDVNPYTKGVNRGAERLVTGSDGSAYYTTNHYDTFTRFR